MNFIKECPFFENSKSKFKQIKASIVIIGKGPYFRYIEDLQYLSKEICNISGNNFILDVINHFSKCYQDYSLIIKCIDEVLTYINLFIQSFVKTVIFQRDNGLELCNSDLSNFRTNNDIKIINESQPIYKVRMLAKVITMKLKNTFMQNI